MVNREVLLNGEDEDDSDVYRNERDGFARGVEFDEAHKMDEVLTQPWKRHKQQQSWKHAVFAVVVVAAVFVTGYSLGKISGKASCSQSLSRCISGSQSFNVTDKEDDDVVNVSSTMATATATQCNCPKLEDQPCPTTAIRQPPCPTNEPSTKGTDATTNHIRPPTPPPPPPTTAAIATADCNCSSDDQAMATSYHFFTTNKGKVLMEELLETTLASPDKNSGPMAAINKVGELMLEDPQILSSCHPILHRIGQAVYAKNEEDGDPLQDSLFNIADIHEDDAKLTKVVDLYMLCNGAYLHGILEHYMAEAKTMAQLNERTKEITDDVCELIPTNNMRRWECYHGVGHGRIQFTRRAKANEALEEAFDYALTDQTYPVSQHRTVKNGIWMDHFAFVPVSSDLPEHPIKALSPCYEYQGGPICFMYAPTAYLLLRARDYHGGVKWCELGCKGDTNCASYCVNGLGMQIYKENFNNMAIVEAVCDTASTTALRTSCIRGGYSYHSMVDHSGIPAEVCQQMKSETYIKSCCGNQC